MAAILKNDMTS